MIYAPLLLLSIVLFELFCALQMGRNAKTILSRSQEAARVLASSELADEQKEMLMRRGSVEILKATLGLAAKFLLACGILFALFELIVTLFPRLDAPLRESLVSPTVIVMMTVAVMGYAWIRKTLRRRIIAPATERSSASTAPRTDR